jgi:DNA (cytosine-5)-methyltransferase 1
MRFIDLFAGVGGFRLAMERAGHECVFSSEIDKYCRYVYKKNFGVEPYGDIRTIKSEEIPDFDILCAGFPCQDVSLAGKRKGLKGERTGLFYEIVRIAKDKKPKYLFLENVKGLLSSNKGWDFAEILITLDEIGYDVEWSVINSSDVVPQNRERIFIIGHFRERCTKQIFPIREGNTRNNETSGKISEKRNRVRDNNSRIARTLVTRDYKPNIVKVGNRYRKLTPTEYEKLQTFPVGWTAKGINEKGQEIDISDTQRYKMMGNAITVKVVYQIAKRFE